MSDRYSRTELKPTHPDLEYGWGVTDPGDVVAALRWLTPSSIPAVVLASLATLSVPALSDICRIEVTEDTHRGYLIQRPLAPTPPSELPNIARGHHVVRSTPTGQLITSSTVLTPFRGATLQGEIGYYGVVTHLWDEGHAPHAMDAALAQVAVDRAVALVHEQRLASRWHHADTPSYDDADIAPAQENRHALPDLSAWTK